MSLADDDAGFELELQNGVLNLVFEEPSETKFVVSPNAPVRQIWVSAMGKSYKLPGRRNRAPSPSTAKRSRSCSIASPAHSRKAVAHLDSTPRTLGHSDCRTLGAWSGLSCPPMADAAVKCRSTFGADAIRYPRSYPFSSPLSAITASAT